MGTTEALWLAVIASGIYHGINPGMGWPLAVSAGLMERRDGALLMALASLAAGHFAAMAVVLLPFTLLISMVAWMGSIQVAAGFGVAGFGVFKLLNRRHARLLSRIKPTQLAFWSFAAAIAHGAGFMLVPIYLGLCRAEDLDRGHAAAQSLIGSNIEMAMAVSALHASAMITTGGLAAWICYRYLGLKFISKIWFNAETIWALSLVFVGILGVISGLKM